MSEAEDKVLQLLSEGTISAQEAETLLAAMRPAKPPWWRPLLDPLELRTSTALALSLAGVVLAIGVSTVGVRFDGPIDTHFTTQGSHWARTATELACNWLGLALALFLAARVFARRGRLVDFVVLVGVARAPIAMGGAIAAAYLAIANEAPTRSLSTLGIAAPLLAALCWAVVMMIRGFGSASGLRGPKLLVVAISTLLGIELATKALLFSIGW